MTLANGLTILRGLLVPPMIWSILAGMSWAGFGFFVLAVATDAVDGALARLRREVTPLGKILDPAMDKTLYVGIFSALAAVGRLPVLGPLLYAIPQLGLGVGALVFWRRRTRFVARWPGKAAAAVTAVSAALLLVTPWGQGLFWGAVAANFLAAVHYLLTIVQAPKEAERQTPSTFP